MASTIIKFRCSDEEKARWTEQAGDRTLTDYFKYLADKDAGLAELREGDIIRDRNTGEAFVAQSISMTSQASIARPTPTGDRKPFATDWKVPSVKKKGR